MEDKLKIGFFASGGGSNVEAILKNINMGEVPAEAKFIISNNSQAGVAEKAEKYGVPFHHISSKTHPEPEALAFEMIDLIEAYDVELIVLAGYIKKLPDEVIEHMKGKVINIHPSLLPKFGGQGMYGMNVHRAVVEAGETMTGCTVHQVSDEYDEGRILGRCRTMIEPGDSAETVAQKVLRCEHELYSIVIGQIAKGQLKIA
ncbi:MAG: phosphoribosylglycinamide formyltransferase [Candidatus Kapaibacteriales bacterium]